MNRYKVKKQIRTLIDEHRTKTGSDPDPKEVQIYCANNIMETIGINLYKGLSIYRVIDFPNDFIVLGRKQE